jgi:hypothetical protein
VERRKAPFRLGRRSPAMAVINGRPLRRGHSILSTKILGGSASKMLTAKPVVRSISGIGLLVSLSRCPRGKPLGWWSARPGADARPRDR